MRHWSQLATRNLRARPGRAFTAAAATALGVGTVIWVTSSFESVKRSISEQIIDRWVGRSHLSVESPLGHWGDIDAETIDLVRNTEGVIRTTPRLKRRMVLNVKPDAPATDDDALLSSRDVIYVDAVGIDPSSEYAFRTYEVDGRTPDTGDRGVAVIEANTAREFGLAIGDRIRLELYPNGPGETLQIIGLSEVRRVAKFQRPLMLLTLRDLQRICGDIGKLTVVDAMIADPSADHLERAAVSLRKAFRERGFSYQVTTATARLNQLAEAQRQTEFALLLVSSVALLTAFFIIMTTMSMGMVERIGQLGTLRCLGMTRRQLAALVLMEVGPVGIAGLVLGVPIGLALTYLGTLVAQDYVQEVVISPRGLVFALIGGAVTIFAAAILPALGASRVSPLAASRPQSKPTRHLAHVLAALLGAFMVALHIWMVQHLPIAQWFRPPVAIAGVALLYFGCGLITPLAVRVAGGLFVQVAARLLRIKPALLNDQVDRAAWRGAGICCGLMVGLSLLIGVVVHSASVRAGWDFPKRLAEAFVWTRAPVPRSYGRLVSRIPGVSECTIINDFLCEVGRTKSGFFDLFRVRSTFVAGEPDVFLTMTKLEFLEGNLEDARSKLLSGGYILLPPEASRAFGLHLGDRVEVAVADRRAEFEVAGVIQSPALDIAVTYFQADSYMMVAAAGSVLGTLDDARKHFGIDGASLFLMNFTLPDTPHPPMFESQTPPAVTNELVAGALLEWGDRLTHDRDEINALGPRLRQWASRAVPGPVKDGFLIKRYRRCLAYVADRWEGLTPSQRWDLYCDRLIMRRVVGALGRPNAIFGSLRQLKQQIDDDIREATLLLATIPLVALIVAALGVGNLMTANVNNRSRQIAVLRAVGATKGQIMRLVLGEAVVLGAIGSAAGVALGLRAARTMSELTVKAIGFEPVFQLPWLDIAVGILLTVGVCVVAGLSPARHASRNNIIDAMRTA